LMPSFETSDESGTGIQVPYYWNIAPNRDATIRPKNLTKRGMLLGGEYRYLHSNSAGRLDFEYLPDDKLYKDDRHLISYKHNKNYGQHWNTDVQLDHVSDNDYFLNLGDNLGQTSTTHLERHANINYSRANWSVFTRFQSFQPVGSSESYRRLPQIKLSTNLPEGENGLSYHLDTEYVNFDHKNNVTTGSRFDISPGISFDLNDTAYFIRPKLGLRHTRYSLDQPLATDPENPSRTTPIFSLDSGIFLERESSIGSWGYLQTLEPRVYYLYVPYKDQSLFPVFDTGSLSDSMAQLFRENRFSGADRQGDANQISTSITTRFIDNNSGQERLSASIGQIYYLDDRKVNISGNTITRTNQSDLFAEIRAVPWDKATLSANVQWDTQQNEVNQSSVQLQYKRDNQHIVNATYRFQTQTQEQASLSSIWPINNHWSTVAHWDYSFKDEGNTLEGIGGIQYDTCCWSARLVYRNYMLGDRDNNTIFLQFALKGLSRIGGEQLSGLLEEKISGYQDIEDVQ
ncbi:MAG: LPS assembly protein LptD, partial [Gammaproteobacteria bacterium]|nr:LPS assembly protein LptD [Gammaproteobacteria bacterium]